MSTKHRLLLLAKNPLVIIPPLILLLALGWQQYTYAGRDLSLPQGVNLLSQGNFSQFDENGLPVGWHLGGSSVASITTMRASGYAGGESFRLRLAGYQSGDVDLSSPKVVVTAGKTYLFKGYYNADKPFSLLMRVYHADGSSSLKLLQPYTSTNSNWSTVSSAFTPVKADTAVQFVFRLYSSGTLTLNGMYLEEQAHVYVAPQLGGLNLIPNSLLSPGTNESPSGWSTYHAGTNTAAFSYLRDAGGSYVETQLSDYVSGEAKWQYPPRAVQAHQYYQCGVEYRSDTRVPVVAEYVLKNGKHLYQTLATLPPASQWTDVSYAFEVPSGARNMFVSLPLQHGGVVDTRHYQLINITRSPDARWTQPVVSLTFDSGRQSQYSAALPVLQRYGYKATFYINPSTIETNGFMTAVELSSLSRSGNEIGARGYDPRDMTTINEGTLDYQLHTGRDYLRTAGFRVTDFATPFGRSDAEVRYYARQYYDTLRGTDTGVNTWQNFDPYDLKVLNISSKTTAQQLGTALATAKAENGWLILVYQDIGGSSQSSTSPAAFKHQMQLIQNSGLAVRPVHSAYAAVSPPNGI